MRRFLKAVRRLLRASIYALTAVIGLLAFLYPVVMSGRTANSPLLLAFVVGLSFIALLLEVQGDAVNVKFVALLGILTAMNAALRFAEVAIPGPGGFSPIFFLIIVTGYVYGGRFGFLLGALTLLVSAVAALSDPHCWMGGAFVAVVASPGPLAARRRALARGRVAGVVRTWLGATLRRAAESFFLGLYRRTGRIDANGAPRDGPAVWRFLCDDVPAVGLGTRTWQRCTDPGVRRADTARVATFPQAL
jgi:hypothetical protein